MFFLCELIHQCPVVFISWAREMVQICEEELDKHKDQIEEEESRIEEEDAGKVVCLDSLHHCGSESVLMVISSLVWKSFSFLPRQILVVHAHVLTDIHRIG